MRKAARLAVYDEMRMREKNHHATPTIRPDTDLGVTSVPFKKKEDVLQWILICPL